LREYLTPLKTKDVYTFQNEKVSELIDLLKIKNEPVDFSAMECELANLIDSETDIKTNYDVYLDAPITAV
jgi:hypothetical protein